MSRRVLARSGLSLDLQLLAAARDDLRRERVAFVVLGYAAAALLVHEYALQPGRFASLFPDVRNPLGPFAWWAGGLLLFWVALPTMIARGLGFGPAAQGWGLGTLRRDGQVFALLAAVAVPIAVLAARDPAFAQAYPLVVPIGPYTWSLLAAYWACYLVQFIAVEYFFRGFLPFTLAPRMGAAAVAVSAVPYALIHLHKPWPEAAGAVAGGMLLAWLALRVKSIWGGVAVHVVLALTMDVVALGVTGRWPD